MYVHVICKVAGLNPKCWTIAHSRALFTVISNLQFTRTELVDLCCRILYLCQFAFVVDVYF